MTVTTIKVTVETRDRLKGQAAATGLSLGDYVAHLADKADREARFAAIRAAQAATPPAVMEEYWRESREWLDADLGA
ncbi:type II toxin-antitoxin system antitoxin MazE7 [Gordonia sp. NPDC003376]